MMMDHFKFIFDGLDYEQTLKLFWDETLVFYGIADDLVTSVSGELQVRLTFSGNEFFIHTLRLVGEFVVLVPVIASHRADAYLRSSRGIILVWPFKDFICLWERLRYDLRELKSVPVATSNELFLVWLISSGYSAVPVLDASTMADLVSKNILAEDIDGIPSTKEIIAQLSKQEIFLGMIECISSLDDSAIIAYIDDVDSSTIEWKSISSDRKYCLIGNNLGVRLVSSA